MKINGMKLNIFLFIVFIGIISLLNADEIIIQKTEKLRHIPKHILGIAHPLTSRIKRGVKKCNKELNKLAKELNSGHVRGPGGTGSNFFRWKEGRLFKSTNPGYEKLYGKQTICLVESSSDDPKYRLTLDECWDMANYLNKPYVYCLNMISDSDEEIRELVKELLKRAGKRSMYIELGNEIYAIHYQKKYPTVKDYLKRCRKLAKMIKSIDKKIKVGICCISPIIMTRILKDPKNHKILDKSDWEFSIIGRLAPWQAELEKFQDDFDAIIIHYYNRIRTFKDKPQEKDLMMHLFAENQFFSKKLNEFAKKFPEKELWLTEWNIMNRRMLKEKEQKKRSTLSVNKYLGTALVLSDLACRMIENQAVTLTSIHCLYTANGFGLLNFKNRKNRDDIRKLPQFYAFKAIGEILKDNDTLYTPILKGPEINRKLAGLKKHVKFSAAGIYIFGNDKQPKKLLLINRTDKALSISFTGYKLAEKWRYGNNNPLPNYLIEKRYSWVDTPDNVPTPEIINGMPKKHLILTPWTMIIADICEIKK